MLANIENADTLSTDIVNMLAYFICWLSISIFVFMEPCEFAVGDSVDLGVLDSECLVSWRVDDRGINNSDGLGQLHLIPKLVM